MTEIHNKIAGWPKNRAGAPVFKSTNDAIFYAHLAFDDEAQVSILRKARLKCYIDISLERQSKQPNLQHMMNLAVNAQFYRECLEEAQRISDT